MISTPGTITLEMVRETLYSAVVADALRWVGISTSIAKGFALLLFRRTGVVGRCKTTLWVDMAHEDANPYELELMAVDSCKPDDVLIAAAGGSMRSGIWGELLSTAARNSGCIGTIVDGAVRDVAKMRAMGFTSFARGTCLYDSLNRQRVVNVDVPIEIDGVIFSPGDLVMADVDGVVVIPRAVEERALQRAWAKVHAENITRDAIKGGMKAVAAYGKFGVL